SDRLLPEDDAGTDLAGKDQTVFVVLDEHDTRAENQKAVRPGADVTPRQAQRCEMHGVFRRQAFPERDSTVEAVGIVTTVMVGDAEAGDAQRQPLRSEKSR